MQLARRKRDGERLARREQVPLADDVGDRSSGAGARRAAPRRSAFAAEAKRSFMIGDIDGSRLCGVESPIARGARHRRIHSQSETPMRDLHARRRPPAARIPAAADGADRRRGVRQRRCRRSPRSPNPRQPLDVVIVGAGLSGLVAAYELEQPRPSRHDPRGGRAPHRRPRPHAALRRRPVRRSRRDAHPDAAPAHAPLCRRIRLAAAQVRVLQSAGLLLRARAAAAHRRRQGAEPPVRAARRRARADAGRLLERQRRQGAGAASTTRRRRNSPPTR